MGRKDKSVYLQNWMDELVDKSESTRKNYLHYLQMFCKLVGKTPDELIEERIKDLESEDEIRRRSHERLLKRFFVHLEEQGFKRNSAVLAFAAVRSFYKTNLGRAKELDVTTPRAYVSKQYRALSKTDIRAMCESVGPRGRAYILCQVQSGLSVDDLANLRYDVKSPDFGTIREQLRKGMRPIHIQILRGKEEELGYFNTFMGSNACDALDEYSNTSWPRLFDVSKRTLQRDVEHAAKAVHLENVSTHSLRKFFNTQLKLHNVNADLVEHMMGHTLAGSRGHYLVPPIPEFLDMYAREMEPYLTIY